MAIESIGAVPQAGLAASLRNVGLQQEDYLNVLHTQLSFQDPLKPLDNQEFITQIAQFTCLDLNRQYNEKADTLLKFESANQAIGLIGRKVSANTQGGLHVGRATTI